MMPMASNLQMIFFRNRKGDVLVKLVYNDKETYIPAVQTYNGVFHKWNDLREYLVKQPPPSLTSISSRTTTARSVQE